MKVVQTVGAGQARLLNHALVAQPNKYHHQKYRNEADFVASLPTFVFAVQFSYQQQKGREEPQILDKPQRSRTDYCPNEVLDGLWYGGQSIAGVQTCIEIAYHPLKNEKSDSGRNQKFSATRFEPNICILFIESITRTDAGQQKHQSHKPWIQNVEYDILVLRSFVEAAYSAQYAFIIEEIEYVVKKYQQHAGPAQIV